MLNNEASAMDNLRANAQLNQAQIISEARQAIQSTEVVANARHEQTVNRLMGELGEHQRNAVMAIETEAERRHGLVVNQLELTCGMLGQQLTEANQRETNLGQLLKQGQTNYEELHKQATAAITNAESRVQIRDTEWSILMAEMQQIQQENTMQCETTQALQTSEANAANAAAGLSILLKQAEGACETIMS